MTSIGKLRTAVQCLVITALITTTSACGTLMHPERKGQTGGRIDAGVAVLNGVGLLFFFIPGVIAYAVDFSNGTIYLPNEAAGVNEEFDIDTMQPIVLGVDQLTEENIRAVVQSRVELPIREQAVLLGGYDQLPNPH